MPTVSNTVTDPAGDPIADVQVVIRLIATIPESTPAAGFLGPDDETIVSQIELATDALGEWSTNLVANSLITPAGTYYLVSERPDVTPRRPAVKYRIEVPDSVGPHWAGDLLTEAPDDLPSAVSVASAVSFNPVGTIAATNVQAAIAELEEEVASGTIAPIFNVATYGAVGDGVTDDKPPIQAAMDAAAAAGGGLVYFPTPASIYRINTTLTFGGSNIRLVGSAAGAVTLNYHGAAGTAAVSDDGTIRRNCGIDDIKVACITAGAYALSLTNAYRWVCSRSRFESQNGTTGIALLADGDLANSCYFNTFNDCEFNGSLAAVKMNDNINAFRFFGGIFEGAGYAVWMPGTVSNSGSNMFVGVGIQSEGTNTAGVIIQLGTNASAFQASYNTFVNCRIETTAATTIQNANTALYNAIIGGSIAGSTTINDAVTATGAQLAVLVTGFGVMRLPTGVDTQGGVTVGKGGSGEFTLSTGGLSASGSNVTNLPIRSKGAAAVAVNANTNDGTGGLQVHSGGATPALRAGLGPNRAADLYPAAGNDAVRVFKSTNPAQRIWSVSESGAIGWGDGTAVPDTNLYRSAADILATDDDLAVVTAGKGLRVKEGSNAKQGVATLVAGTVTVSNTSVTANSRIQLTIQSLGTVVAPKAIGVTARTAGTSFTITSADATDTSVVAYQIFEPA